MKKNVIINIGIILGCFCLLLFGVPDTVNAMVNDYANVLLANCSLFSGAQLQFIQTAFTVIRIVTPILVVVLIIMDFVTAVTSQKEDDMKKAQKKAIRRLIIGVIIMFVPTIVNLILDSVGQGFTTCGIK